MLDLRILSFFSVWFAKEIDQIRTNLLKKWQLPWGEWTLRLMGRLEIPLLEPVTRSVSFSISFRISVKLINFWPFAWRNSPYSVGPLISWRIKGRLVTIPFPRGRKSLKKRRFKPPSYHQKWLKNFCSPDFGSWKFVIQLNSLFYR